MALSKTKKGMHRVVSILGKIKKYLPYIVLGIFILGALILSNLDWFIDGTVAEIKTSKGAGFFVLKLLIIFLLFLWGLVSGLKMLLKKMTK